MFTSSESKQDLVLNIAKILHRNDTDNLEEAIETEELPTDTNDPLYRASVVLKNTL